MNWYYLTWTAKYDIINKKRTEEVILGRKLLMKVFKSCKTFSVLLMVFGIVLFSFNLSNTKYEEYGGDGYTGIQHASADTANNVKKAAGYLVFAIGIMLSCYSDIKKFEYE